MSRASAAGLAALSIGLGAMSLAMSLGTIGCDTTRPGVTKTFVGEYTRYYAASGEAVHAATQRVFQKLELMPVEDTFGGSQGKLTARNFQDTQVAANIKEESPASTLVKLKVHPGESESFSIRLLQMINEELKR